MTKYIVLKCNPASIAPPITVHAVYDSDEEARRDIGHLLNRYIWCGESSYTLYKCIPLDETAQLDCIGKTAVYIDQAYGRLDND